MCVTPNIKRACVKKFAHAAFADGSAIHSDGYRSYIPGLEGYRAVTLGHGRLLFCVHRDHPLANEQVETLTQVAADYAPNVIQYTSQVFTILQHIRENAAAGFLSEDIAEREESLVGFALWEVEEASITVIWRKDAQVFPAMEGYIT